MNRYREISATFTLVFIFFACSVAPALGAAGSSRTAATWDDVKQLTVGQEIMVVQKDAKAFRGRLAKVSDEAIVVRLTSDEQTIARDNVERVSSRGASHRLRNVVVGAGVGFGAGAGIGAAAGNPNSIGGRGIPAAAGGAIGLAAGAAVGAALPSRGWHEVYRAP